MDDRLTLGAAFMGSRPKAAARVLAAMDSDDAAVLLASVPTRTAAAVLAHMHGWAAAERMLRMDPARAAAVIRRVPYADALAIVRLMNADARLNLFEHLPSRLTRDMRRSLSYPQDTVGAHMTTETLTLAETDTVADAKSAVRSAGAIDADVVFVVDEDKRLVGVVAAVALLRYAPKTPLSEILELGVEPLPARARIGAITDLDLWDDYAILPVVSRRQQVVGGLTRRIARGRIVIDTAPPVTARPALLADMLAALADTVAGLVDYRDGRAGPADTAAEIES